MSGGMDAHPARQSVTFARTMSELWLSEKTSFSCCQPSIAATTQAACSFMSLFVISHTSLYSARLRTCKPRCNGSV